MMPLCYHREENRSNFVRGVAHCEQTCFAVSQHLGQDNHMKHRAILFGLLALCFAVPCLSQSHTSSGDIKGTVTDSSGAVLPGAMVTVTNIDTGVERSTI